MCKGYVTTTSCIQFGRNDKIPWTTKRTTSYNTLLFLRWIVETAALTHVDKFSHSLPKSAVCFRLFRQHVRSQHSSLFATGTTPKDTNQVSNSTTRRKLEHVLGGCHRESCDCHKSMRNCHRIVGDCHTGKCDCHNNTGICFVQLVGCFFMSAHDVVMFFHC